MIEVRASRHVQRPNGDGAQWWIFACQTRTDYVCRARACGVVAGWARHLALRGRDGSTEQLGVCRSHVWASHGACVLSIK